MSKLDLELLIFAIALVVVVVALHVALDIIQSRQQRARWERET